EILIGRLRASLGLAPDLGTGCVAAVGPIAAAGVGSVAVALIGTGLARAPAALTVEQRRTVLRGVGIHHATLAGGLAIVRFIAGADRRAMLPLAPVGLPVDRSVVTRFGARVAIAPRIRLIGGPSLVAASPAAGLCGSLS